MQDIKQYLKDNILLTDGAMGTYYHSNHHDEDAVELANLTNKEAILNIHKEYISAGARLIRTNTFSANTYKLGDMDIVAQVITAGYNIAKEAADDTAYVGASIGPIPNNDDSIPEYTFIIDIFLNLGADIFVFETFNNYQTLLKLTEYIKSQKPNAFILTQFALTDIGVTKKSVTSDKIISELSDYPYIDALGFNCGVGPMHMLNILKKSSIPSKYFSALPNAGYPEVINDRIEYVMNPKYFAEMVIEFPKIGVNIVGGCCGTTPEHIALLSAMLPNNTANKKNVVPQTETAVSTPAEVNPFHKKLRENKFVVAVELDPPFKPVSEKIIASAKALKEHGVDIITIADSPMGKPRADSMLISAKILRDTGIDTLPHICCRDRNSIALRSAILGAYIEGIRNLLVVTGDPVQGDSKVDTKSVFNLNSYSLVNMVTEMNNTLFENDPIKIGGAVNFNVKNKDFELNRLLRKKDMGAEFFLTQPIFSDDTIEYIKGLPKDRDYKIFAGIMPLVTYGNVQFINNELPGITIPEQYASLFSPDMTREQAEDIGISISVDIANKIRPYVDGLYINAPFNRHQMVIKILSQLGL